MTQKKMAIYDPAKVDVTANGVTVLADLTSGIPTVPATFEGRVKAHLAFDTGDPMSVVATDELYGPRKVSMRVEGYALLSGAGGTSRERAACGHVTSIELGPVKYDNVPACFGKIALFGHDAGIIGFDFLKHFNLTFDYPESKLYLTPTGK